MSRFTPEMEELVDLFCEGSISVAQAGRLEALVIESTEAKDYLRDSFQVHCELAWLMLSGNSVGSAPVSPTGETGAGARIFPVEDTGSPPLPVGDPVNAASCLPKPGGRRLGWRAFAAVALALFFAVALGLVAFFRGSHSGYIAEVSDARWCDAGTLQGKDWAPALNTRLTAGSKLAIPHGLLELSFVSGVRMTIQGPVEIELQSPSSVAIQAGSLTAEVPAAASGFVIQTPNCTVVDLGTRFGVACQTRQTDVEVFAGNVLLRLEGTKANSPQEQRLAANNAMRVTGVSGQETIKAEPIAVGSRHFIQSMTGSAAMLQAMAESNSHLIHFYPFEGATEQEKLLDRRAPLLPVGDTGPVSSIGPVSSLSGAGASASRLDLTEVAMRDGDGGGRLAFGRAGPDPTTQVVAPFRGELFGASHGRGLQSKSVFQPPRTMTIELLLSHTGNGNRQEGFVAAAVTSRHNRDQCGFLLAAIGGGELACLLDGGSDWLHSGFRLASGRWYYVATTFQVKKADTEVNVYVADLSDKVPTLKWIVRNQIVRGTPASGLLGIGKGFDGDMGSEYPWAGELGHVAIYDNLLKRQTLEDHLKALTSRGDNGP